MDENYRLKKGDVRFITEDQWVEFYDKQPAVFREMLKANISALVIAGLPVPIACNMVYNLLRQHEIALLNNMGDGSMN